MDTNNAAAAADDAHAKAPGDRLLAQLEGDNPAAMIDALHARHFAGSKLTSDTEAWNLVMAFAADVKQLIAELGEAVEKL